MRQEIVVTELGIGIAAHKGIACPQVAKAHHVRQIVIDLVGCAEIKFLADILGYLIDNYILVQTGAGEARLHIKLWYGLDAGEYLPCYNIVRIVATHVTRSRATIRGSIVTPF